jgi:hypothetical protein
VSLFGSNYRADGLIGNLEVLAKWIFSTGQYLCTYSFDSDSKSWSQSTAVVLDNGQTIAPVDDF